MELKVESGPNQGETFKVGSSMLVAGRQPGVDILLNDDQISRRHASFEEVNNVLFLNDLGSANGTRLNGRTVSANQPVSLSPGDKVQIGRTTLVVQGTGAVADPYATEVGGNDPFKTEVAGNFPAQPFIAPASPTPAPSYGNANNYQNPPQAQPQNNFYQNQNQAGGYNANAYNTPSPAPQPQQPYNNNNPYGQPQAQPGGYYQPPAPSQPVRKKGNATPIIIGIVVILVIAVAAVGGIFLLKGNSTTTPTAQAAVNGTPGATVAAGTPSNNNGTPSATQTPPDPPVKTLVMGPSGSNALPPAPPEPSVATPTPVPPTAKPGTTAGASTDGLGVTVTFPKGWKTTVDESRNAIESDAPDGITFSLIVRRSGVTGDPVARLTDYLQSLQPSIPNFTLTQEPKSASSDNSIADAYVTYTDNDGKLILRDYILAAFNKAGDTYFIHFVTADASFDSQLDTFNSILQSIVIN